MNKLSIQNFENLQSELMNTPEKTEIIVSLGTCGIAAGGDTVYEYFKSEISRRNLKNVVLKKTGCLGLCSMEPNVEIKYPAEKPILYGYVTEEAAEAILNSHICKGEIVDKYVISMPAPDFLKGESK